MATPQYESKANCPFLNCILCEPSLSFGIVYHFLLDILSSHSLQNATQLKFYSQPVPSLLCSLIPNPSPEFSYSILLVLPHSFSLDTQVASILFLKYISLEGLLLSLLSLWMDISSAPSCFCSSITNTMTTSLIILSIIAIPPPANFPYPFIFLHDIYQCLTKCKIYLFHLNLFGLNMFILSFQSRLIHLILNIWHTISI